MNPPVVFSTDPHLLAQWRFDERRRRNGSEDAALHRVSMVLGRFPDRVEIRNPAEAPDVVASARAIAGETDKPVYRAALLEMADRIAVRFRTDASPPAEPARPADDWLATLDARIAEAPVSPAAGSPSPVDAQPTSHENAAPDDGLPDFLAGDGWDVPTASSPGDTDPGDASGEGDADLPLLPLDPPPAESVDDALYIPPPIRGDDPPREDGLDFLPSGDVLPREEPGFEPWASPAPHFVTPDEDDFLVPGADEPADPSRTDETAASQPLPSSEAGDQSAAGEDESNDDARTPHVAVPVFAVVTPPAEEFPPSAQAEASPVAAMDDRAEATARLAELGRALGLSVTGRSVSVEEGALPGEPDPLAALDVVWRDGSEVAAAFLIDPPAPVVAALVDLADVVTEVAATPPLFLVGPEPLRAEARSEAARPVFARLPVPLADACGFIPYASLDDALRRAEAFLPYLRPGFVRALAERLDG